MFQRSKILNRSMMQVLSLSMILLVLMFPPSTSNYESGIDTNNTIPFQKPSQPCYTPHDAIRIMGDTNLTDTATSEGWLGDGSANSPFIITGYTIVVTNDTAIHIQDTTLHLTIENCILSGAQNGLYLLNVENVMVDSVECMNGDQSGLVLLNCRYVTLLNVTGYGYPNGNGVKILASEYVMAERITCHSNFDGIRLDGFGNSTLRNAKSFSNAIRGFDVIVEDGLIEDVTCWDNNYGFEIAWSDNLTIRDSVCLDNRNAGVKMSNVDDSTFQNITCTRNDGRGFDVGGSSNVLDGVVVLDEIHGILLGGDHNRIENSLVAFCTYGIVVSGTINDIVGNALVKNGMAQAIDDGSGNRWDDGNSTGNHWSDYSGIGDYLVDGSAGSVDHYPNPDFGRSPLLRQPANISISAPTAITWKAYDSDPYQYTIWINGSSKTPRSWDGDNINYLVEGVPAGLHNVTAEVSDLSGNITISTVWVECLVDIPYSGYPGFVPREPLIIGGNDDMQWGEFSGTGTEEDPYIIKDFYINLNGTDDSDCIRLLNLNLVHVIVQNCIFQGKNELIDEGTPYMEISGTGLDIQRSGNITVRNCTFVTLYKGIYSLDTASCIFDNNTFLGNPYSEQMNYGSIGIDIQINTGHSYTFILTNNRLERCSSAISFHHTNYSYIARNIAQTCDNGLFLGTGANHCVVEWNTFSSNGGQGISLMGASHNNFTQNTCTDNGHTGFFVEWTSTGNSIFYNDFSNNELGAIDESSGTNFFDYNIYSDYSGVDADGDGIGDTPHEIPGNADAVDYHPRVASGVGPTTTSSPTTSPHEDGFELQTITLVIAGAGMATILVAVFMANKSRRYG